LSKKTLTKNTKKNRITVLFSLGAQTILAVAILAFIKASGNVQLLKKEVQKLK
jgi:hypothetical protein